MFVPSESGQARLQELRVEYDADNIQDVRKFTASFVKSLDKTADNSHVEFMVPENSGSILRKSLVLGWGRPDTSPSNIKTVNIVLEKHAESWHVTIVANDAGEFRRESH